MTTQMVGPQRHVLGSNEEPSSGHSKDNRYLINEDINVEAGYYIHNGKLGEGGFAKVRLGTHLKTNQKVAIKCMSKAKLGTDLFRVYTEINALKQLQHENIAKLLQVIENKDYIYLILEYCSGGELFDYLVSKSRLSESESKTIMKDLAVSLAYLHSNGYAHRDLKPENILFDSNHCIKLIDFGLAANCNDGVSSLSHLSTCCGSPAYAAPELLSGGSYSGPSVDVWSAGVLLYALLVGKLPFDDENIQNLYKKIMRGTFSMPFWLSADARDLISSMIQIDPNKRITVKEILRHRWITSGNEHESIGKIQKLAFDDETLWECHFLFPEIPINQLKLSIINRFGYHSATYWLLKANPKPFITPRKVKNQFQRNSVSVDKIHDERKERINEEFAAKSVDIITEKENDDCKMKLPKLVGAKRKINDWGETAPEYENISKCTPNKELNERIVRPMIVNRNKDSPNGVRTPLSPVSKIPVQEKRSHNCTHDKVNSPTASPVPKKIMKVHINSPLCENNFNNTKMHELFTPGKQKFEVTPKKSLFKRLLDATPLKSHRPRNVTNTAKNVTLTTFTDPQQCIDNLIKVLTAKGIECKPKEFTLRCSYSIKFAKDVCTFNLEICKFQDRCVIQRKRLRGDAWHYKKVCEEILNFCNL